MIVSAHDVRDLEVYVIDDRAEVIGRHTIGAHENEVVQFLILENHLPLNQVLNDRFSCFGTFETHGERPGVAKRRPVLSAGPIVGWLATGGKRGLTFRVQLFGRAVTTVRLPLTQ